MPVFWTRGEHGSEHTRNRIEVPIDIAPNLLEQARQRAVAESLEAIFEEEMQNSCPIPMGTSMWLRVCSDPCSPRVQNTGMVASILTSIISAREDFLFRNRSGRSDI